MTIINAWLPMLMHAYCTMTLDETYDESSCPWTNGNDDIAVIYDPIWKLWRVQLQDNLDYFSHSKLATLPVSWPMFQNGRYYYTKLIIKGQFDNHFVLVYLLHLRNKKSIWGRRRDEERGGLVWDPKPKIVFWIQNRKFLGREFKNQSQTEI